jgi:transposase-like protein
MGRPRKFQKIGAAAVAEAAGVGSVNEIARRLGVSRQTIFRWRKAGKLPTGPTPRPAPSEPDEASSTVPAGAHEAGAYVTWAQSHYVLSRAELELVRLADAALVLAHTPTEKAGTRLAAMREFRALAAVLNLPALPPQQETDDDGDHSAATLYTFPRKA